VDVALAQLFRADMQRGQRAIHRRVRQAARLRQPSPSRTTRLNASITTKWAPAGRAISRRQLLVPRSIAA
jgi:hypothetical protein